MWLVTQKLFIKKSLMAISSSQSYCNQLSHTCHSLPKLHCLSAAMLPRPPFRPFTRLCEDGHTKLNVSSMQSLQILAFNVEFAQKSSQMNPRETRKVNCVISGLLLKKHTFNFSNNSQFFRTLCKSLSGWDLKKSVVIENLSQFQLFCFLNVFSAAVTWSFTAAVRTACLQKSSFDKKTKDKTHAGNITSFIFICVC